MEETTVVELRQPGSFLEDPLTEVLRAAPFGRELDQLWRPLLGLTRFGGQIKTCILLNADTFFHTLLERDSRGPHGDDAGASSRQAVMPPSMTNSDPVE